MPGTNEAFSRVKIDAQLKDQGWDVFNPNAVRFEYVLSDKTKVIERLEELNLLLPPLEAQRAFAQRHHRGMLSNVSHQKKPVFPLIPYYISAYRSPTMFPEIGNICETSCETFQPSPAWHASG